MPWVQPNQMIVLVTTSAVMMMVHANVSVVIQELIAIHVILDIMCQTQSIVKIHVQVSNDGLFEYCL